MSNLKITGLAAAIAFISSTLAFKIAINFDNPAVFPLVIIIVIALFMYGLYKNRETTEFSMVGMVLLTCILLMTSCSSTRVAPLSVKVFYQSYGDPRWDDCKDIFVQEYSINIYGDTLPTKRIYSLDCYKGRMKTFADKHQMVYPVLVD